MSDEKSLGVRHLQVRLSDAEYASLEQVARRKGVKLQPLVRSVIQRAIDDANGTASQPHLLDMSGLDSESMQLVRTYAEMLRDGDNKDLLMVARTVMTAFAAARADRRRVD